MQMQKIEFDNIRYNPEHGAFETLVRIEDAGQSYSYPVHVAAPLHAEYALVARGLAQAARAAHRRKAHGLRLARATPVTRTASQPAMSILDRLLGARAA